MKDLGLNLLLSLECHVLGKKKHEELQCNAQTLLTDVLINSMTQIHL